MVTISSSQKKTAFAVILLALIAAWVMISGRGGFSSLRSDAFNNPSFVCSEATQTSGKAKYDRAGDDIQKFSAEKTSLQTKIQSWGSDIRKNEAQIKKLENEKKAAEKTERTLDVFIKKNCGPRSVANCAAKRKDLQKVQQEIKKIQNSLVNVNAQNSQIRKNMQGAESSIKLLEKQIQEIKNFKGDYETCKRALEKEKTEVASFDLIVSGEVFVNEPFDITVRAMKSADMVNNKYEGKIFFDTNNNPADVVLPLQENDGGSEYQFQAADNGIKVFTKGLTLKKAGTYEIVVFELRWSNGGIEKKVQIVAKEKTSPVTCTDSDNGYNYFTKGQTTLSNGVVSADFCSSANTLDEYICPTTPSESGVSQSYTCPHGCNDGACKTGPYCGNGIKEWFEQCDDGNTNWYDSCDNTCKNTGSTISGEVGVGGKLTLSLDSSTPLFRLLLDNTSEHPLGVFRFTAWAEESLDVDSINIENWGLGKNGVKFYKFYDGSNLIATSIPDANGNVQLYIPDGTLIIPANDYKLITVKALLYDINGTTFSNEDTISIVAMGAKATGRSSWKTINSMSPNIEANVMLAFEAYPIISFAFDANIGSTINLGSNQLIAKIALVNPGDKSVSFQSGDSNLFSVQVQVTGDDTDTANETIILKDQDGITLDTASVTSASGITKVDFNMSNVSATIGTTIPAGGVKFLYIYADTSDLEDNGNQIQLWLDDANANNLSFGINGIGNYSVGNIMFLGDIYGPVLSRSF